MGGSRFFSCVCVFSASKFAEVIVGFVLVCFLLGSRGSRIGNSSNDDLMFFRGGFANGRRGILLVVLKEAKINGGRKTPPNGSQFSLVGFL